MLFKKGTIRIKRESETRDETRTCDSILGKIAIRAAYLIGLYVIFFIR
jgi:hypothetical protein